MEMVLDRQISDQRIYPAIDIFKSGTRREELLLQVNDLEKINTIRRGLAGHRPPEAIERLLSFLKKFPDNLSDAARDSWIEKLFPGGTSLHLADWAERRVASWSGV